MRGLHLIRNIFFTLIFLCITGYSNAQVMLALDGPEWKGVKEFEVKGRNGILIKQKLFFDKYFTTSVDRSWLKGYSSFDHPLKYNSDTKIISTEYIDKNQTLFFAFEDSTRRKADVHCVKGFSLQDVKRSPTLVSIFGNMLGLEGVSDLYYSQIFTSADSAPWHLLVSNEVAERNPQTYVTKLARSKDEYYLITPYRKVRNNKGKTIDLTFGVAGFKITNRKGEPLAAVSLVNKGMVYLKNVPLEDRFLLAALCSAMLLEDQILTQ
jgi:hypothetical protein